MVLFWGAGKFVLQYVFYHSTEASLYYARSCNDPDERDAAGLVTGERCELQQEIQHVLP